MSNQELLEEAKRRYPIGTIGIDFDGREFLATKEPFFTDLDQNIIAVREPCGGVCYHNGKWAEIVSKLVEETRYWECVSWDKIHGTDFTVGRIYKLVEYCTIDQPHALISNSGTTNGDYPNNRMLNKPKQGGSRLGSGAKAKYNEQTTTISFRVPVSKSSELKELVNEKLKSYQL